MKSILINSYKFNLQYAEELVIDVNEELMTQSPGIGLENHPAFTLGHLASAAAMTSRYLGGQYNFAPDWEQLFKRKGPGDPRKPDKNKALYPSKRQLLNELNDQHARVEELISDMDDSRFEEPAKWRYDDRLSTLGDLIFFMCITHESMHLGQLAAWRRAMDMPSALARL